MNLIDNRRSVHIVPPEIPNGYGTGIPILSNLNHKPIRQICQFQIGLGSAGSCIQDKVIQYGPLNSALIRNEGTGPKRNAYCKIIIQNIIPASLPGARIIIFVFIRNLPETVPVRIRRIQAPADIFRITCCQISILISAADPCRKICIC